MIVDSKLANGEGSFERGEPREGQLKIVTEGEDAVGRLGLKDRG